MTALGVTVALAQGIAVGAAVVFVFSVLGLVTQSAAITGTRLYVRQYGFAVCMGTAALCALHMSGFSGNALGVVLLPIVGVLAGMYVGMLLSSLTEMLNIFPALSGKLNLINTVKVMVVSLATGKTFGVLVYYLTPFFKDI